MASSLPILQFEPFIMENGEKLGIRNLGIRWKKNLTKFENFLIVMNINEDKKKLQCCYILEEIIYEILTTMVRVEGRGFITQPLNI